jgi:tRNA(Arg) A34 adenosine deaminase TadA
VLTGATLYIGLESCLMCTGVVYWSGLRRVVFAIPKELVSGSYYETPNSTQDLFSSFNEKIEMIHAPELQEEALKIVRDWEEKNI